MRQQHGYKALAAWVERQQQPGAGPPGFVFLVSEFANYLGVSRQILRMWIIGAVTPDAEHRARIESATSGAVPARIWRVSRARRAQ